MLSDFLFGYKLCNSCFKYGKYVLVVLTILMMKMCF